MEQHSPSGTIAELLEKLNYWVSKGGDPAHRPDTVKSTGEANARVAQLKRELQDAGADIVWNGEAYVLK